MVFKLVQARRKPTLVTAVIAKKRKASYTTDAGAARAYSRMPYVRPVRQIPYGYPSRTGAMAELKNIDCAAASGLLSNSWTGYGLNTTATGDVGVLNNCVTGTAATTRIGRKMLMKSLFIRGLLVVSSTTTSGGGKVRIVIVYDRQPNGVLATAANTFQSLNVAEPCNQLMNLDYRERFKVLADIEVALSADGPESYVINRYINLKNLETDFNIGTAGTIADVTSGSIQLWAASTPGFTGALPYMSFATRIRFSDG